MGGCFRWRLIQGQTLSGDKGWKMEKPKHIGKTESAAMQRVKDATAAAYTASLTRGDGLVLQYVGITDLL